MKEHIITGVAGLMVGIAVILAGAPHLDSILIKIDALLKRIESWFILPQVIRVLESDEATTYCKPLDVAMRWIRDNGWLQIKFPAFLVTTQLLKSSGINSGNALEIGPGSGYLGLEWLRSTKDTTLVGLDISSDMVELARCSAREYGFTNRASYLLGDGGKIPFGDGEFDCVFSNASLHEWVQPKEILNEIARVLKPDGKFHISDLRRDVSNFTRRVVWFMARPREVRPYFMASVKASYTVDEILDILRGTRLKGWNVSRTWYGLAITRQSGRNDRPV